MFQLWYNREVPPTSRRDLGDVGTPYTTCRFGEYLAVSRLRESDNRMFIIQFEQVPREDVRDVLEHIAARFDGGDATEGVIQDAYGDKVGYWQADVSSNGIGFSQYNDKYRRALGEDV